MNIYEMFGRQAERLQESTEYFAATQKLLNELVSGTVLPSNLVLTQQGWTVDQSRPGPVAQAEDGAGE